MYVPVGLVRLALVEFVTLVMPGYVYRVILLMSLF